MIGKGENATCCISPNKMRAVRYASRVGWENWTMKNLQHENWAETKMKSYKFKERTKILCRMIPSFKEYKY